MQRLIGKTTMLASAARTESGDTHATSLTVDRFHEANFFLSVTAVSGTNPTLDVVIKTRNPTVTTVWETIATFTQATATTTEMKSVAAK